MFYSGSFFIKKNYKVGIKEIVKINGYRLMVDRSSSKRCVPIRIRLAVKG